MPDLAEKLAHYREMLDWNKHPRAPVAAAHKLRSARAALLDAGPLEELVEARLARISREQPGEESRG